MSNSAALCQKILKANPSQRYIFGINEYADSIAEHIDFAAYIDDFTRSTSYKGKPVIKTSEVPDNALVISALAGRPFIARKVLQSAGIENIDYFSFYQNSGFNFKEVRFWSRFEKEYVIHKEKYQWIAGLLCDRASQELFKNIIDFRLSGDLSFIEGFRENQANQYFEDFLDLQQEGEVFVDVGGFDGYTSQEFIKRCPAYKSVYIFEPEEKNISLAKKNLANYSNIHFMQKGLSNKEQILRFSPGGSISKITEDGSVEIQVDKLDDCVNDRVSFIKMDIEGAESEAIEGAANTIIRHHPKLAICVYHKPDDLWRIPSQILSLRSDYKLYLRHYTEGVVETVMFFIPITEE